MIRLASLAVFSGLSLNLLIQFALGTASFAASSGAAGKKAGRVVPYFQLGVLFISVLFLWILFTFIIPPFWNFYSMLFLYFPASVLICMGLESLSRILLNRTLPKFSGIVKTIFPTISAYDGLIPASLILTITLAGTFAGAFTLSLFFSLGNLIAILILNEIHRRSELEWVPAFLRGTPLILISIGFLSLISSAVAIIFLRILEVF